jgi:hypothetical protein
MPFPMTTVVTTKASTPTSCRETVTMFETPRAE